MIPYGALADRIGKKPIFILTLLGLFLAEAFTRVVCFFPPSCPSGSSGHHHSSYVWAADLFPRCSMPCWRNCLRRRSAQMRFLELADLV